MHCKWLSRIRTEAKRCCTAFLPVRCEKRYVGAQATKPLVKLIAQECVADM